MSCYTDVTCWSEVWNKPSDVLDLPRVLVGYSETARKTAVQAEMLTRGT